MRWTRFLERASAGDHAVHVYAHLDDLAPGVVSYLDAGLNAGAPALVIATPGHRERFAEALVQRGWDVDELEREGRLEQLDADKTLAAFMQAGMPSAPRFQRAVGAPLERLLAAFPGSTIRAFGEMVDLLWQRGQRDAALALETLWNELLASRNVALLCGYRLDPFDPEVQAGSLPLISEVHSHVRPVVGAAALDHALADTVGSLGTARIYLDVAEQVPRDGVPRTHEILGWLSMHRPRVAKEVLETLRDAHTAVGLPESPVTR